MLKLLYAIGFTLMELLITIAILGILVAIATPVYLNYTDRSNYAKVLHKAETYKVAVSVCRSVLSKNNSEASTNCVGGSYGIPANFTGNESEGDRVKSITVTYAGNNATRIHVVPFARGGIKESDTITIDVHYDVDTAAPALQYDMYGPACQEHHLVKNCKTTPSL